MTIKYVVIHNTAIVTDRPRVVEVEQEEFLSALSLCPGLELFMTKINQEDISTDQYDMDMVTAIDFYNRWAPDNGGSIEKLIQYDPDTILHEYDSEPDEKDILESRRYNFDQCSFYCSVYYYLHAYSSASDATKDKIISEINSAIKNYDEYYPLDVKLHIDTNLRNNIATQSLNVERGKILEIFDETFWKYIEEHGEVSKKRIYQDQWLEQDIEMDENDYSDSWDYFETMLQEDISEHLLNNPIANPYDWWFIYTGISNSGWTRRSGHMEPTDSFISWDSIHNRWTIGYKEFKIFLYKLTGGMDCILKVKVYTDYIQVVRYSHDEPTGAIITLTAWTNPGDEDEDEDI